VSVLIDSCGWIPFAVGWGKEALYIAACREGLWDWGFRVFKKEPGAPFVSLPFPYAKSLSADVCNLAATKGAVHMPADVAGNLAYLFSPDGGQSWLWQGLPEYRPKVFKPKIALLGRLRVLVWVEGAEGGLWADRLVAATSRDGQQWSRTVELRRVAPQEVVLEPEIVSGGRDFLLVFWSEGRFFQREMRKCYTVFDGTTWSAPVRFLPDSAVEISIPRGRIDAATNAIHLSYSALYPSGREVVCYGLARLVSTKVETEAGSPPGVSLLLGPAYPNPFNSAVTVSFELPPGVEGVLEAVDATGRRVAVLWKGCGKGVCEQARWEGESAEGEAVSSGLYLLRLTAGRAVATRKVVLLR